MLGKTSIKEQYNADKVQKWYKDIKKLADLSASEPQAAYYISGWNSSKGPCPTINISDAMEPLEHEIRHMLLHKLLCRDILERDV